MTDQTVSIPVDLLQELKQTMPISSSVSTHIVGKIVSYISPPPKVGDALRASQTRELPFQTVVVDNEGDVWVGHDNGKFYMAVDGSAERRDLSDVFEPYTLVYLPEESE